MVNAGRGFGKTRIGAEFINRKSRKHGRMAMIGATSDDIRGTMIEGESGIFACSPPWHYPEYQPSRRQIVYPNGSIIRLYAAESPERLRGPQHEVFWGDEIAAWKYPTETFDNLMFGLRIGPRPHGVLTTTPKPKKIIRDLLKAPDTFITRGSSYDNLANLAPAFKRLILSKYEGTTIGRQELYAELLEEVPGAVWKRSQIDLLRVQERPEFKRIVIAVDPATTSKEDSDETGIMWGGLGYDDHVYVCGDLSARHTPDEWANVVVGAFTEERMDRIVYESNQGGDMIPTIIKSVMPHAPTEPVHASSGKRTRAEPVGALYEQGKVHHVGVFPELEDQQCNWTPGDKSPDRMDALVYLVTELMGTQSLLIGVEDTGDESNPVSDVL